MSKPKQNKILNDVKNLVAGTMASYAANRMGSYFQPAVQTASNMLKGVNPVAKAYSNASRRKEKEARQLTRIKTVQPPVSVGTCINDVYMFRRGGKPLPNAEFTVGERFVGRVMLSTDLVTSATLPNSPFSALALTATATNYIGYAYPLTPATIGGRLAVEASMWQYYAFRKTRVRFIPRVGTSSNGAVVISLSRDSSIMATQSNSVYSTNPSFAAMSQFSPSMMFPVWEPCSMEDAYVGTKCWGTRRDQAQSVYGGITSPALTALAYDQATIQQLLLGYTDYATAGTIFGSLIVEFEVDFYSPSLVLTSNAVSLAENKPKPELREEKREASHLNPPLKSAINSTINTHFKSTTEVGAETVVQD